MNQFSDQDLAALVKKFPTLQSSEQTKAAATLKLSGMLDTTLQERVVKAVKDAVRSDESHEPRDWLPLLVGVCGADEATDIVMKLKYN